jgi:VCBS repeat-containing protein
LVFKWNVPTGLIDLSVDKGGILYVAQNDGQTVHGQTAASIFSYIQTQAKITPNTGGDTGLVTATITLGGFGFLNGTAVKLSTVSAQDIIPVAQLISPDSLVLTATFNLTGQPYGIRDVIVVRSDGTSLILSKAFTIVLGRPAEVWVDLIGPSTIRPNVPQTFTIVYGNKGNVNAQFVPLIIAGIPAKARWSLGLDIVPPPKMEGPDINWTQIPIFRQEANGTITIPLYIPVIPPLSALTTTLTVTIPAGLPPFPLKISATPCYFDALTPGSVDCMQDILLMIIDIISIFLPTVPEALARICVEQVVHNAVLFWARIYNVMTKGLGTQHQEMISTAAYIVDLINTAVACTAAAAGIPPTSPVKWVIAVPTIYLDIIQTISACKHIQFPRSHKELIETPIVSRDPNGIQGPRGAGQKLYVQGTTQLSYTIFFGNEPNATASAQQVIVNDPFDPSIVDLSTLSLGPVTIGNRTVSVPLSQANLSVDLDLRPVSNLIVRINAALNQSTNTLVWQFTSIDPNTGIPTTNPQDGFLPPDTTPPLGEGSVFFTIMPKQGLSTGTPITDQASITFDANPAIKTPIWTNTIDSTQPTSHVVPLPLTEQAKTFTLQWSGTDVGSGIQGYGIFVSENGQPYRLWQGLTNATSAVFNGTIGSSYAFFSRAIDNAGNVENVKLTPDTSTLVTGSVDKTPPTTVATASPAPNQYGWNNGNVTVTLTATDETGGSGVRQLYYALTGAQSGSATITGNSVTLKIYSEGTTTLTYYATDNAGNVETIHTLSILIDKTPPQVRGTADRQPNSLGWYNRTVKITWSGIDSLSGIRSCDSPVQYSGPDANSITLTGHCIDKAGNIATGTFTFKYDSTPPVVNASQRGASIILNAPVGPQFTYSDALSGIASCNVTTIKTFSCSSFMSQHLNTTTVGPHSYLITVVDNAGNIARVNVTYNVVYRFGGFVSPNDKSVFTLGRTVKVKFVLFDYYNNTVGSAVARIFVDGSPGQPSGHFNTGNLFRFDPTKCEYKDNHTGNYTVNCTGQYEYRLATKTLTVGPHTVTVQLDDGTTQEFTIVLRPAADLNSSGTIMIADSKPFLHL